MTIRDKLLAYFRLQSIKEKSRIIHLPYSYTILADYLAINRSAMNRELKHLKDEKVIDINKHMIRLNYDI